MSGERLYKVTFLNQGQVYEIFAKQVVQGGLLGFVEVDEVVFGTQTQLVVDPTEERLQREFEGVKRSFIPIHSIVRIDEVDKQGQSRISELPDKAGGNVTPFPLPMVRPGGGSSES